MNNTDTNIWMIYFLIIVSLLFIFAAIFGCNGKHVVYSLRENCLMVQQKEDTYNCYLDPESYAKGEELSRSGAQISWSAYFKEAKKRKQFGKDQVLINSDSLEVKVTFKP